MDSKYISSDRYISGSGLCLILSKSLGYVWALAFEGFLLFFVFSERGERSWTRWWLKNRLAKTLQIALNYGSRHFTWRLSTMWPMATNILELSIFLEIIFKSCCSLDLRLTCWPHQGKKPEALSACFFSLLFPLENLQAVVNSTRCEDWQYWSKRRKKNCIIVFIFLFRMNKSPVVTWKRAA